MLEKLKEIVIECVNDIYNMRDNYFIDANQFNFNKYYKDSKNKYLKTFLTIMSDCLNELDKDYNQRRDKNIVAITHKNKAKPILTEDGELIIKRNRYKDRKRNEPFYYLDDLLNLKKRQRITDNFQAEILKTAIEKSYKYTEKKYNNVFSYMTAINIAKRNELKLKEINEIDSENNLKYVNKIHIEADEDHIHLFGNKNIMAKLVYIHEGYKNNPLTLKRELINPHYFSSTKGDLWKSVKKYIKENYAPGTPVVINGDGAAWIKNGIKNFNICKFYLDKFHTYQAITRVASKKASASMIKKSLINKDMRYLDKLYWDRFNKYPDIDETSGKMHGLIYLMNNLNYISLDDKNVCCSAEGHVSHVLSARMSSRPMAWTAQGANRMAQYRAFHYNNGDYFKLITLEMIA